MKKLLLALLLLTAPLHAQVGQIQNPVLATLTVQDSGTCSTANSYVAQQLPQNASTTVVNLAGTFSGTVTIRETNNGGASWTTAGTASAAGTTTAAEVAIAGINYGNGYPLVSTSSFAVGTSLNGYPAADATWLTSTTQTGVTANFTIASGDWGIEVMTFKCVSYAACTAAPPASTYYLSPTGNDTNTGLTSGASWLTPLHSMNCGDVILAAASSSYVDTNFRFGQWGTVTCAAGNNVAWLKCATFDTCKMTNSGTQNPMAITASYWGVQGWEVTSTADSNACFIAYPQVSNAVVHHIIFANNIANGCHDGGIGSGETGTGGVDYLAILGNAVYNAAQSSGSCFSGIDIFYPLNSDTLPGTHYYIAGNFAWSNLNPNPCQGAAPTDGEGIILDTLDGSVDGIPYTGQMVVDNNILLSNGGRGFQVFENSGANPAPVYARHNTAWGNNNDTNQTNTLCGELLINVAQKVEEFQNLAATNATSGCDLGTSPLYAYSVGSGNGTDHVYNNTAWVASGTYTQAVSSAGFSFGPNNTTSATLSFANAVTPGAPSCGSFASVPACMATVIANFTPTTAAAKSYGYQIPSTTSQFDPLYPQWLCGVTNLPAGLITMGCGPAELQGGSIH